MTRRAGDSSWSASLAAIVVLLGARNLAELRLPDGAYVPTNVVFGALLVGLARRAGVSWPEIGFERDHLRRAAVVGGAAASAAIVTMLAGAALPATRGFFDDGRVPADASGAERLYQTALRIPVGTVAFEEIAFRGVLLAVLCRRYPRPVALVIDSALFGLWHIVPTLATARANGIVGAGRVALVAGSVLATFVGGVLFCALRWRGGHLAAPVALHLAFNDTGYLLAWWARR